MKAFFLVLAMVLVTVLQAQNDPVTLRQELRLMKGATDIYELVVTAKVDTGWYIYSQTIESEDGPIPTSFGFEALEGVEYIGYVEEKGKKTEGMDPVFQMNVVKYTGEVQFIQIVKIQPGVVEINGFIEYMSCNNEMCLPPKEISFTVNL